MGRKRKNGVRLFPKIYRNNNLKRNMKGIDWSKPVLVEEKFDGSNIGIKMLKGKLEFYSRNNCLGRNPKGNFEGLKELVTSDMIDTLNEGDILFCEYIGIAQLPYNKTHKKLIPIEIKRVKNNRYHSFLTNEIMHRGSLKLVKDSIGNITTRDKVLEFVNSDKTLSLIDGKTPIEGVVIKQVDTDWNIIAREKIVANRFLKIRNVKYKEKKVRFPQSEIAKFEHKLIEDGVIDINETDKTKIMITMFKQGNNFYKDYWEENSKKELKKLEKDIKKDLNYAIKERYIPKEESNE